jgi:hypothetical protein
MGGGLMQLVAYGAQDIYLTGNPQITFFKVVYRRHTNFSMEAIEQTFNGAADFGKRVTCTVSRNGDLMHKVYLQVTVPADPSGTYVKNLGQALIKFAEVEIGGQRIDKHYGDWMHIWNELSQEAGKKEGYGLMTGAGSKDAGISAETDLYIPLEFWFCRNPGLALPLIALQYHEVKINIEFSALSELTSTAGLSLSAASLYVDYIYLDTDERRRFAQVSHEYLIEQVQFTGDESVSSVSNKIKLNFNHPCKELVWVVQRDASGVEKFDYTDASGLNPVLIAKLQLNGHDRFSERMGRYFNLVQPYQHHTNVPKTGINVYSFGLKPEEHQPSGTCNMSRIDNATLQLTLTSETVGADAKVRVYATNYNVLRIMSGMGGLAYSN